jgi:hypothetical protein
MQTSDHAEIQSAAIRPSGIVTSARPNVRVLRTRHVSTIWRRTEDRQQTSDSLVTIEWEPGNPHGYVGQTKTRRNEVDWQDAERQLRSLQLARLHDLCSLRPGVPN